MKKFLVSILMFVLSLTLISCVNIPSEDNDIKDPINVYLVTFETFDGSYVAEQIINENETAIEPDEPVRLKFVFDGWYEDETLEIEFDFSTIIIKDTTIYAKWKKDKPNSDDPGVTEDGVYNTKTEVVYYIISFGKLPSNYFSKYGSVDVKKEWTKENKYSNGGDTFNNNEGLLPNHPKGTYTEADIEYEGTSRRNAKRIVFSYVLDLYFYTDDHYDSFIQFDMDTMTWK